MIIELSVQETDGTKRFLRVDKEIVRVGRNPECDICFEKASDESVSWDHAIIVVENDLRLIDQDSSNGSFVNNQRVERVSRLTVGDKISLGIQGPKITVLALHAELPSILDSPAQNQLLRVSNRKLQLGFALFALGILLSSGILLAMSYYSQNTITESPNVQLNDFPSEKMTGAAIRHEPLPQAPKQPHTLSVKEESSGLEHAPSPRTPLTREQVKELFSTSVVWIGMRISDPGSTEDSDVEQRTKVIPWCTGWINEEGKVVVAADRVLDVLKAKNQAGVSAQVCQPTKQNKMTEVASASTHPLYDPASPVSDRSQLHNAGTLSVPDLALATHSIAEPDGLSGKTVLVFGYFEISDTEIRPFSRLTAPTLEVRTANIGGTRPCSNCDHLVPLMRLNWEKSVPADEAPRCDGMLVADEYGGVLGHVVTMSDGDFVLPIENIRNQTLENQSINTE